MYWIELDIAGRLAIMARPRAGDGLVADVDGWKAAGVDSVVCLLEPEKILELGLQHEAELCRARAIDFHALPIPDFGVPESREAVALLARNLAVGLQQGRTIAIHCFGGIGRSSMIAACVLACCGIDANRAFTRIAAARGVRVPETNGQRAWVTAFGEAYKAGDPNR